MLFNACLEKALQRWKSTLTSQGIALDASNGDRLTNIRYADDILLFAKSWEEARGMLETLVEALREVGLEVNAKKTIILSTHQPPETTTLCDTDVGFIEILHKHASHKYLGRCFTGDLRHRAASALEHRIGCGWGKFRELEQSLLNKDVGIKLRFRLFNATVSPTVLYALDTAPLTEALLCKLDRVQRCMLRKIVGWIWYENDSFEERGRRMKLRLQRALEIWPVKKWSLQWHERKQSLKDQMTNSPSWTQAAYSRLPPDCDTQNGSTTYPSAGRPRTRW